MCTTLSNVHRILDFPDEILIHIIAHLNARERISLGNSCSRFNNLVFEDPELLRDLDFSKEGRLTSVADIRQYFINENTSKHVLKLNILNVKCMKPGRMLTNLIGSGINLVDINLHGTEFRNIQQFASFLEPLINLKRLSIDWPKSKRVNVAMCCKVLQKPFSRLTYLSLGTSVDIENFLPAIPLCQKLEELSIIANGPDDNERMDPPPGLVYNKLKNLRILRVCGYCARPLKNRLGSMLLDDKEWADFHLVDVLCDLGYYLEKNVELCTELQNIKLPVRGLDSITSLNLRWVAPVSWFLISENLLREVIKITREDVPETFCCLTEGFKYSQPCLLKINEAKRLLEDPGYQISFLHFKHKIEPDCDAHLVVSAFPDLRELIVSEIVKREVSTLRTTRHFQKCLRRRDSTAPGEYDDPTSRDTSFKMLVENTPHVRDFSICGNRFCPLDSESWDMDAFSLISSWKNLRILRLHEVPLVDGKFLIEIGKKCAKLEEILFYNLGHSDPCRYTSDLSQMLKHCRNLMKFSLYQCNVENLPDVVNSLTNNLKLKAVRLWIETKTYDCVTLASAVEQLLLRCQKLTTFSFIINQLWEDDSPELANALQRIVGELNRPNFQFEGPRYSSRPIIHEDASSLFFPRPWDE